MGCPGSKQAVYEPQHKPATRPDVADTALNNVDHSSTEAPNAQSNEPEAPCKALAAADQEVVPDECGGKAQTGKLNLPTQELDDPAANKCPGFCC